jgi:hypothetical protein
MRFRTALAISIHSSGREYGKPSSGQEQEQEHSLGEWNLKLGESGANVVHVPEGGMHPKPTPPATDYTDKPGGRSETAVAILLFEKYFRHMEETGQGRLDAAAAKREQVQRRLQDRWAADDEGDGDSPEAAELACVSAQRKALQIHQRRMSQQQNESKEDDDDEEWYLNIADRSAVPSFSLGNVNKRNSIIKRNSITNAP